MRSSSGSACACWPCAGSSKNAHSGPAFLVDSFSLAGTIGEACTMHWASSADVGQYFLLNPMLSPSFAFRVHSSRDATPFCVSRQHGIWLLPKPSVKQQGTGASAVPSKARRLDPKSASMVGPLSAKSEVLV
eukprot:scaffold6978_cov64-Phaeocystis_antarctica.AAC.5